jgi:transcriptional regulator with PAS, ATPase and Fis domain
MWLETILGSIKEFVIRFSDIISNTVDSDVIIADNNLKIVGSKFRYFTRYNEIEVGSLISEVILKKEKVIVKDKGDIESCRECDRFHECKMIGFVGVPIYYKDRVIGAIALLLPQHRVESLFQTIDTSIEFLENMGELLAGKIEYYNQNQSLSQIIVEREAMMDLLSDAVVFTDYYGNIQHCNSRFKKLFTSDKNVNGKPLQELLPHAIFDEYFSEYNELKNIRVYISCGSYSFYGFVSSKQVIVNGKEYGTMFVFETMNQVQKNVQLSEKGSMVTLKWAEWIYPRDIIQKSKALAVTGKTIFISSKNRNLSELLAKGITNFSERSLNGLKILFCDNMYRDLLNVFLFDEFGELRDANNGTMLIHDVENLPLYVQERLLYFIKTGNIRLNNDTSVKSDARLIFSSTCDLKELAKKGLFLEELYYHISENEIIVPNLQDDMALFQLLVNSGLSYYGKIYQNNNVSLDKEVLEYLFRSSYKENLNQLESVLEAIVKKNDNEVTLDDIKDMGLYIKGNQNDISLSTFEMERISELLKTGCSKSEIARRLGIGRATLYRKLVEYGLSD